MKHIGWLAIFLCLPVLSACHKQEEPVDKTVTAAVPAPPTPVVVQDFLPLAVEPVKKEFHQEKCRRHCADVKINSVAFPANTTLTALVDQELAHLAARDSMVDAVDSVDAYAQKFLRQAGPRYSAVLEAKVLRQAGPLVVLQLDSWVYTGGAHGNPGTRYLNIDRRNGRLLLLDDVIVDGQRPALTEHLRRVHAAWNKALELGDMWPFKDNDNFALTADGLRFKYPAYAVGPYVVGEPELLLPYAQLQGVIKPEWVLAPP